MFYVIEEGTFTIFDNSGRELARVSKGSCFGELALMHQASVMIDKVIQSLRPKRHKSPALSR